MKRFWDTATVAALNDGYTVLLDGKQMHLPGGAVLQVQAKTLADAIADEWQAAGGQKDGEMSFADTPLTRLTGTAQQRIAPDPAPTIAAIARYGQSDLLCYRAETPDVLVARQEREWQPWLDWLADRYAAPLRVSVGIQYIAQPSDSLQNLRAAIAAMDVSAIAALGITVPALGSLALGLALAEGELDAASAHRLSCLDELFQAELWGEDDEAAARRNAIRDDVALAARFFQLTRPKVAG